MCTKHYFSTVFIAFSILILLTISCAQKAKVGINSFQKIQQNFSNPPMEYRTIPLTVWNDDVTEEKIDGQIDRMYSQGIGGIFVHPRYGFMTDYLSDRYFSLYKYAYEKLKNLGMIMWIYDENGFPSGIAGGHVRAEMPESAGKSLIFHHYNVLPTEIKGEVLVILKSENSSFIDITNKLENEKSKSGDYYIFELIPDRSKKNVDLLHKGVTEKFLEITFEKGYKKYFGKDFGKIMHGAFQDEAEIAPSGGKAITWTPDLFSQFKKMWGYDLTLNLPSLFEEVGNWKKVRHNYYSTLLELFIERWGKVYYKYCEKNNMKFTGHYWEHEWPNPSRSPDNMAMAGWQQMPGVDMLVNRYSEGTGAQFGNVRSVKEISSIANQMGLSRTLSETYGGSGWEIRFEDLKRNGDWEYAIGVNFMSQHLFQMTLKGIRKRDWPLSFYHEPWWKFYRVLADYYGRLSLVLSSGEQINKLLVIEPTSSAWMYYSPTNPNVRNQSLGDAFQEFITNLAKLQVEYDLGCENTIKDFGSIKNGKFAVGKREYEILVLPPGSENLNSSTVSIIEKYLKNGGKVVSFVEAINYVDGSETDKINLLASKYINNWIKLNQLDEQALSNYFTSKDFSVMNPENISGILYHNRRQLKDGEILFFVNTSESVNSKCSLKIKGNSVLKLDALSGNIVPFPAKSENGFVYVDFDLLPIESLLLFISPSTSQSATLEKDNSVGIILKPVSNLQIEKTKPNVLTIDYCDLKLDGKEEKGLYHISAHRKVYQFYGMNDNPWRFGCQYKTEILDLDKFPENSGYEVSYSFDVDRGVNKETLMAVAEQPNIFKFSINGHSVEPRSGERWLEDYSFAIFDIGKYVVTGTNFITLKVSPFTINAELECVYVLGDFNLKSRPKGWGLVKSSSLSLGEWNKQGIPFYSDCVAYKKVYNISSKDKKYLVKLNKWHGTMAEVQVNNKYAGIIAWPPYSLDISDKLNSGNNEITVIVYGSLRNLLGPHHSQEWGRTSPWSWDNYPEKQPGGDKYNFVGYGLFEDFLVIEK